MNLNENDLKYIVTESVKKIIKEFNHLLYGNDTEYFGTGFLSITNDDLYQLLDYNTIKALDYDIINTELDRLKDNYGITFDKDSEIIEDDGLYKDINKLDNEILKSALLDVYYHLYDNPKVDWE